jgi:hypothetical protein
MRNPGDVLPRIQPHVCHYAGEEGDWAGLQVGDRDRLPFQVTDGAYALRAEQFEAADMHSSQDDNRIRLIQPDDEGCREVRAEVGVAGGERHLEIAYRVGLDIMHIEESLGLQQLFGYIQ